MDDLLKKINVAYIEGRPSGHPTHSAYAKSVNSKFNFVDFKLRYHDVINASRIRRYLSWILSAISFPKRRDYNIFLSEEAYFMVGLMRKMRLISRKQKLFSIMGTHTLYYLHTNLYSKSTKKAFIKLFNMYDAFICEGPIQYELMVSFLGENSKTKVYQIFNGSPAQRFNKLIQVQPLIESYNIVTIGSIPNQSRIFYKGIDLMLAAFSKAKQFFPQLTYTIVGDYDEILVNELLNEHCPNYKKDVFFIGQSSDLSIPLKSASLCLHTARGEAWGISVTEAMNAGVPTIVSEWTGSKEVVSKVSEKLIVPLNVDLIAEKIIWYFGLELSEKRNLSEKARQVAMFYTEENAVENFKVVFKKAYQETVVLD